MTIPVLPRALLQGEAGALPSDAIDLTAAPAHQRFAAFVANRADQLGEASRLVERSVFGTEFGMSIAEHAERYDAYDDASLFFGVVDRKVGDVVGAARVVLPSTQGLLSVQDMRTTWSMSDSAITRPRGHELPLDRLWDIATLAVLPEHRRGVASWTLYQAVCTSARRCAVAGFVAILDVPVHRMLRWSLRGLFRTYDVAPALYAGSISVPVWCDLSDYERRMQRECARLYDRLFFEGAQFDEADLRPGTAGRDVTLAQR